MTSEQDQPKTRPDSKFQKHIGKFMSVIGFIADFISISSLFFSTNSSYSVSFNPWHSLMVLILVSIFYFGVLRSNWRKIDNLNTSNDSFKNFITDILFKFKYPFLFIPIILLIMLLFWNIYEIIFYSPIIFAYICGGTFVFFIVYGLAATTMPVQSMIDKQRAIVDENWIDIERKIESILKRSEWAAVYDLDDIANVFNLNHQGKIYALSSYAVKYPDQVSYEYLFNEKGDLVSGSKVLIRHD